MLEGKLNVYWKILFFAWPNDHNLLHNLLQPPAAVVLHSFADNIVCVNESMDISYYANMQHIIYIIITHGIEKPNCTDHSPWTWMICNKIQKNTEIYEGSLNTDKNRKSTIYSSILHNLQSLHIGLCFGTHW